MHIPRRAWIIPALAAIAIAGLGPVMASDKPSATFCWLARQARDVAGSERAAEDAARARGVSEATIAKAKRCSR